MCIKMYGCLVIVLTTLSAGSWAAEQQPKQASEPRAYVYSLKTISQTPDYCGWPTITKTANGELLAVYSGGREWHVCPFGRIELIRSKDNGQTWSKPELVIDTILDDRDTAIFQTPKGSLLVTWFTSTYWIGHQPEKQKSNPNWQKMLAEIKSENYRYESIKKQVKDRFGDGKSPIVDQWMMRSDDNGKTWSQPYLVPLMAPHGPIAVSDDRLLWAGKSEYIDDKFIGICESTDDGKTWQVISRIPAAPEQKSDAYYELHIAEASDGTLIAHIRNHNEAYKGETLQTESKDGGKSWSELHSIGVDGFPAHLLCLKDNTLVMTYGHRRALQVEARISTDNGKTWSLPLVVAGRLYKWDFGYPATVQLDDGKLLTIWYEVQPDSPNAVIRQAIWKLD